MLLHLLRGNFAGPVYPVNPEARSVRGVRAYPAVTDIPDDVDLADVSIVGCSSFTAYGAVSNVAGLSMGDKVAVVAAGGVGSSVIQFARAAGVAQVIAVDVSDEKLAAIACVLAIVATRAAISPVAERYTGVETGLLGIDLALLAAFVAIALRSERFWPLWIAGLQLTNSMAHLMKVVDSDLMPRAYAAAAVFWSYPILLIIIVTLLDFVFRWLPWFIACFPLPKLKGKSDG